MFSAKSCGLMVDGVTHYPETSVASDVNPVRVILTCIIII